MLNRYLLTGTIAALCSASLLAGQQQQPQPQPPAAQQPETRQPAEPASATQTAASTTVVGCVYRERDVPGRAPNVAERVGILEDYILMEIPGAQATASTPGATSARGETASPAGAAKGEQTARGTTGTAATAGDSKMGRMYKLEFVDDERLQTLVGRRVQVTGQVDAEEGDSRNTAGATTSTTDEIIGRDRVDLSEFEVSSIREVDGTCPSLTGDAK